MSDRLNTTTKKRQNSDSTFNVKQFQPLGFAVQAKSEESTTASKSELWENYQQAKHLNQGTNRSSVPIQTKLTIGQPGDKYEQEADSVADRVMAMSEPTLAKSTVTNSVQQNRSIQPIQKVSTDSSAETTEESKQEGTEDQIQAKEATGKAPEISTTSAKIADIPNEPTIQRDSPGSLPPIPNYQLTTPSLLQPPDPSSRHQIGGDMSLQLDPQFQLTIQHVQEQINPTIVRSALSQINLALPTTGNSAPTMANPLASPSQPTPSAPSTVAESEPDRPRSADGGDLIRCFLAVPEIETAVDSVKTQAIDLFTRDWQRLNTGERILGISSVVTISGGLLAGVIANPDARQLALDQLNGTVLPVPGLNWLHLEVNTAGDNLMLGLHLDVGMLLPSSLGFEGSSPDAIGGVPEPEPFPVQRKSDSIGDIQPSSNLEDRLNGSKGGGSPLSDDVRSFMEPRFGADFSDVRVHTGSDAVQMNQDVNAQAFAHGQDVYFGAGKAPGKDALTAHELTHVVQQTGGIQTKPLIISGQPDDKYEQEADTLATKVMATPDPDTENLQPQTSKSKDIQTPLEPNAISLIQRQDRNLETPHPVRSHPATSETDGLLSQLVTDLNTLYTVQSQVREIIAAIRTAGSADDYAGIVVNLSELSQSITTLVESITAFTDSPVQVSGVSEGVGHITRLLRAIRLFRRLSNRRIIQDYLDNPGDYSRAVAWSMEVGGIFEDAAALLPDSPPSMAYFKLLFAAPRVIIGAFTSIVSRRRDQAGEFHDGSFVGQPGAYPWEDPLWAGPLSRLYNTPNAPPELRSLMDEIRDNDEYTIDGTDLRAVPREQGEALLLRVIRRRVQITPEQQSQLIQFITSHSVTDDR